MRSQQSLGARPSWLVVFVVAAGLGVGAVSGQPVRPPHQVAQAFSEAWGKGDVTALLSLVADDVRGYDRSSNVDALTGQLSSSIGSRERLAAYYETASAKGLTRETLRSWATIGELVVAFGESAPPTGATNDFLTAYRVHDGRIQDLWHLAWTSHDAPASRESAAVIEKLVAAGESRDAGAFLALFDDGARHFCHSNEKSMLAAAPCDTVADHAAFSRNIRSEFAEKARVVQAVNRFAAGDLAVVQTQVTGVADAPDKAMNAVTVYRVREGRIVSTWLLGEETLVTAPAGTVVQTLMDALTARDPERAAAVFALRPLIYRVPTEAHTLAGPRLNQVQTRDHLRGHFTRAVTSRPGARYEVVGMVSLGGYVMSHESVHTATGENPEHVFSAYFVRNGQIESMWQMAAERIVGQSSGTRAQATIYELTDAHNRGDAEAFVALYHPDAQNSHSRNDPTRLGGAPPARRSDHASRLRFYRALYAKGPATPLSIIKIVSVGEWVAARERYAATSTVPAREHLNIYRVRNGRIINDWHVAP